MGEGKKVELKTAIRTENQKAGGHRRSPNVSTSGGKDLPKRRGGLGWMSSDQNRRRPKVGNWAIASGGNGRRKILKEVGKKKKKK